MLKTSFLLLESIPRETLPGLEFLLTADDYIVIQQVSGTADSMFHIYNTLYYYNSNSIEQIYNRFHFYLPYVSCFSEYWSKTQET